MPQPKQSEEKWEGGWMYPKEENFRDEVLRFLGTRRQNRGATEWQIHRVATARPFAAAMEQARADVDTEYFRSHKEQMRFYASLRRDAVFPVVKKLLNEGYTVAEISDALTIPYSTAYYYAKKIKNHKRLREDRTRWHIDKETDCIAPIKLPRDKEAALARKEIMRKAQEKRERRLAKRAGLTGAGEAAVNSGTGGGT